MNTISNVRVYTIAGEPDTGCGVEWYLSWEQNGLTYSNYDTFPSEDAAWSAINDYRSRVGV